MSLIVYPYRRDVTTGSMLDLPQKPLAPHNDLAGFEVWRCQVWGGGVAQSLGLVLLPSLARTDLYVEGPNLDRLQAEVRLLIDNARGAVGDAPNDVDGFVFRCRNILEAIRLARLVPDGGVCIC